MGNLTITEVGQQLPAVSKTISQAKIDQFERVGIR
jgi:hypothetical protein